MDCYKCQKQKLVENLYNEDLDTHLSPVAHPDQPQNYLSPVVWRFSCKGHLIRGIKQW